MLPAASVHILQILLQLFMKYETIDAEIDAECIISQVHKPQQAVLTEFRRQK